MSEEQPKSDPFSQWIQFCDDWTRTWAGTMSDTVASKSFADSMAQQMESGLDAMSTMRQQLGSFMDQYLAQFNLPSRSEVLSLGERFTQLEMRLDDLDAKLDQVHDQLKAMQKKLPSAKSRSTTKKSKGKAK